MNGFFSQYKGVEIFFLICALAGGLFVLLKFIMQFSGLDHDTSSSDMDMGGHGMEAHHADSDIGFKFLSLHGITSFMMMFGLVGLALYRQSQMGVFISMVGAIASGVASVWIIGKLFMLTVKMKSSGTISIESTVGAQGKVYLTIPKEGSGSGRVLINVRNSLREYDAITQESESLSTGTPVRVVWVDGNMLVVERL
jgi:membrane protein implicated in regulation of membrane protease activity